MIPYIIVAVLFVVYLVASLGSSGRTNTGLTTQRVFDYGDVLTDAEEASLTSLIERTENAKKADIIIVTLNESLEAYALSYEPSVRSSEYVRVFAENFYEENQFGYDTAVGTGTLFVDNWYREADGSIYSWMLTSGDVKDDFTQTEVEYLLDDVLMDVDNDPYGAYCKFVTTFSSNYKTSIPSWAVLAIALVGTGIFVGVNMNLKSGKKTTVANTYVSGGRPDVRVKRDMFLNKVVTKRVIPKSNGGGGGGHGGGGGGGGFGGGGHSR